MNKQDLLNLIGEVLREDYMDEPTKEIKPAYIPKNKKYKFVYFTMPIAIFKDAENNMWAFDVTDIPMDQFAEFADRVISHKGKTADETEYEDSDIEYTPEALEGYVNSMISNKDKGIGVDDFESGVLLVKIDSKLAEYLLDLFKGEKGMLHRILQPLIKENKNDRLINVGHYIDKNGLTYFNINNARASSAITEDHIIHQLDVTQKGNFIIDTTLFPKILKLLKAKGYELLPWTEKFKPLTEITINGEPINANDINLGLVVVDKNKGEDWQIVDVYKKTKEVGIKNLDTYNTIDITITRLLKNYYKKSDKLMKINETKKMKKSELVNLIKECYVEVKNSSKRR